jgi:ABC-type phosphate/phosphonate transport system substrate-binding protein
LLALTLIASIVAATGCTSRGGIPLLNLIPLDKPVVVALVSDNALSALNPFSPYDKLRERMTKDLGRRVRMDLCLPFQVETGLQTGFYTFAVMTPGQFMQQGNRASEVVVATSVDTGGQKARPAVLVVRDNSDIEKPEQLREKIVAFGPNMATRTHIAALKLLAAHGITEKDLQVTLLPTPGLKHYSNGRAVMQAVLSQAAAGGFVDQATWDTLPDTSEDRQEPARSRLRIIARTEAYPDYLIVASPSADASIVSAMREFLTRVGKVHPDAVAPLNIAGYVEPDADSVAKWRSVQAGAMLPPTDTTAPQGQTINADDAHPEPSPPATAESPT